MANVCPKSPKKRPKIKQSMLFVLPGCQIHVFPTFFDGRRCRFERSSIVLSGSQTIPRGSRWLQNLVSEGSGGPEGIRVALGRSKDLSGNKLRKFRKKKVERTRDTAQSLYLFSTVCDGGSQSAGAAAQMLEVRPARP